MPEKLLLINVAGVAHGPPEFARSPIHDNVANYLRSRIDVKDIFVHSTDVMRDPDTQKVSGIQLSPSYQCYLLRKAVSEGNVDNRIPVALAHSSGSIATMATLRDGILPYAIFVSPTFLNPREEMFGSPRFSQRVKVVEFRKGKFEMTMEPNKMYPIVFPNNHLDDLASWEVASKPEVINEIVDIFVARRARIFLGEKDWNIQSHQYTVLFPNETELV